MIPYDELVIALQTWRAKEGLPVARLSGALSPPAAAQASYAAAPVGSPPRATPPATPSRGGGFLGNIATPPPLATLDDSLDVDASALVEESHEENQGGDFAGGYGGAKVDHDAEATSIGGGPPSRSSDSYGVPTDPGSDHAETDDQPILPRHNRNDDW